MRRFLPLLLFIATIVGGLGIVAHKHMRIIHVPGAGYWYYDPSALPNLNGGWLWRERDAS